jgi:hypothetical protein
MKPLKEFFEILDRVETSDNGVDFHPTNITSCRCLDLERIRVILDELRKEVL